MQGSVIIAPIRRTSNISKSNDTKHFGQHEVQKSHQDTPMKYSDDGFPAPSKLCPDAPEALSYQVRLNQKKIYCRTYPNQPFRPFITEL